MGLAYAGQRHLDVGVILKGDENGLIEGEGSLWNLRRRGRGGFFRRPCGLWWPVARLDPLIGVPFPLRTTLGEKTTQGCAQEKYPGSCEVVFPDHGIPPCQETDVSRESKR